MNALWVQRGAQGFDVLEQFISSRIWGKPCTMPGDTMLVSLAGDGAAKGAAIYQNYDTDNGTIEISAAATDPRWLTRSILYEMFSYPFSQLKCQAVVLRCAANDNRMARILRAYGFNRYDIPRLRGRNQAEAIYVLGDDEWRANGFHKEQPNG